MKSVLFGGWLPVVFANSKFRLHKRHTSSLCYGKIFLTVLSVRLKKFSLHASNCDRFYNLNCFRLQITLSTALPFMSTAKNIGKTHVFFAGIFWGKKRRPRGGGRLFGSGAATCRHRWLV